MHDGGIERRSTDRMLQPKREDVHNIEVEQSLLGGVMSDSEVADAAAEIVTGADFFDPLHAKVFETVQSLRAGKRFSVELLKGTVGGIENISDTMTVGQYIDALLRHTSVTIVTVRDYARSLRDLSARRKAMAVGAAVATAAADLGEDVTEAGRAAVAELDDVIASVRDAKRTTYDGQAMGAIVRAHLTSDAPADPTTGLADLDSMIGGWPVGQLSVVAARPGMGKSAMATSSMLAACKSGVPCLFFSLEMTGPQIGSRLLCDLAYAAQSPIYYESILKRSATDIERRRLEAAESVLQSLPMTIEEQRGLTVTEVSARATKWAGQQKAPGVIFVDHMLLLRASSRYAGNRVREVAEISDGLTTLAKDLGCAVVALCQLNRGVEGRDNKRPTLADLRDSGAIEEDASVVLFLYRLAYYLERERHDDDEREQERLSMLDAMRNVIEIGVGKNRNGRIGTVLAYCDIGANALRNRAFGR